MPKALLIRNHFDGLSSVAEFLIKRGCKVQFAMSYEEARMFLEAGGFDFDLMLSPIRMGRRSGLDLIPLLKGSSVTLFFSFAVEEGSWWMPALRDGKYVFGTPAVRSNEFNACLDEAIDEAVVNQQLRGAHSTDGLREATG
jgi:CheY-like chemotaxis protein